MSKTIRHELTYDAPLEAVTAMLADPAFREEVCDATSACCAVDVTSPAASGATMRCASTSGSRPHGMPSFAKKIVGDEINIVQEEPWTSPTRATSRSRIPGKPGDDERHAPSSRRGRRQTVETVELTVKVDIPLVGGKLEGLIADLLLKALKAENKVGRDYLSR